MPVNLERVSVCRVSEGWRPYVCRIDVTRIVFYGRAKKVNHKLDCEWYR